MNSYTATTPANPAINFTNGKNGLNGLTTGDLFTPIPPYPCTPGIIINAEAYVGPVPTYTIQYLQIGNDMWNGATGARASWEYTDNSGLASRNALPNPRE
jgi:hypothetical protein